MWYLATVMYTQIPIVSQGKSPSARVCRGYLFGGRLKYTMIWCIEWILWFFVAWLYNVCMILSGKLSKGKMSVHSKCNIERYFLYLKLTSTVWILGVDSGHVRAPEQVYSIRSRRKLYWDWNPWPTLSIIIFTIWYKLNFNEKWLKYISKNS